ncbi:HmuY family protein [Pedobacter sp. MC2016-14]|uniref:HmuY family protein n=1 Tax=Pedobacter sp. MC2016-14 TaxID=2897327 RepID=UPI001E62CC66|nr:HmuY family protein [Pedobacter sp. MC2016-14]MCD0490511.1 HmuY family protein [Pedobacter sp. MC2016-14]
MKISKYIFFASIAFALFITSCKENDALEPVPEEPEFVQVSQYIKKYKNGIVEVSFLPVDITRSNGRMRDYFSLDSMKFLPEDKYLKTNKWDIVFRGRYSSEVYANYSQTLNFNYPWYDLSLYNDVSFTYVIQNFDDVTSVTDNMLLAHGPNPEDQQGNITGTGGSDNLTNAENYQHYLNSVAWAYDTYNSETGDLLYSTPYANKTWVLKLHDGRYAKFQFINNYDTKPTENNANSQRGFLSFRYYIAPSGSKNLNTK